ncbi:unnamed protein product [Sphagnum jensenii]
MPPAVMLLVIVGLAVVVTMLVTNTLDETKKLSAAREAEIEARILARAKGIQPGFQSKLKEGMRAVTFAVDNNSGVAGFVDPDSRVDIVAMLGSGVDTRLDHSFRR